MLTSLSCLDLNTKSCVNTIHSHKIYSPDPSFAPLSRPAHIGRVWEPNYACAILRLRNTCAQSRDCIYVLRNPEIACAISGFRECAMQTRDWANSQIARNISITEISITLCRLSGQNKLHHHFPTCMNLHASTRQVVWS